MKITKNTTLSEVLKYPGARKILAEHNLPCLYCPMARFEMESLTLEEITKRYNIDLKSLIQRLNKAIKQKS